MASHSLVDKVSPAQRTVKELIERTASLKQQLVEAEAEFKLTEQELTNLKSGYETAKTVTAKQLTGEKANIEKSEAAVAAQKKVGLEQVGLGSVVRRTRREAPGDDQFNQALQALEDAQKKKNEAIIAEYEKKEKELAALREAKEAIAREVQESGQELANLQKKGPAYDLKIEQEFLAKASERQKKKTTEKLSTLTNELQQAKTDIATKEEERKKVDATYA
uniref:Myosin_tail_1 domain-containing protein n=1 Tax=Steinernema glaseri TaxID=37863 RepID=A0A1I7Y8K9_9BILA